MPPLANQTIAIAENRQNNLLQGMLERAGASVWPCPLVSILDAPDQAPVEAWLRELAAGGMDDVIFFTGEGVRRLMTAAKRMGIEAEVVAGLKKSRRIVRGNKPVRELQPLGMREDLVTDPPTTDGVITLLNTLPLQGRRVGVQLYGTDPNLRLMAALTACGAVPRPVAPYVYADAAEDAKVKALIQAIGERKIQAILFTSATQWTRLCEVAKTAGTETLLRQGLTHLCVAGIGPNVIEKLQADSVRVDCSPPEDEWFMAATVRMLAAALNKQLKLNN